MSASPGSATLPERSSTSAPDGTATVFAGRHRRDSTAANHDSHVFPGWTSREVQNLDVIQHDDSHGSVLCGQQYGTRQHQQREEGSRHQALPCMS